jgi:hypothetical protein
VIEKTLEEFNVTPLTSYAHTLAIGGSHASIVVEGLICSILKVDKQKKGTDHLPSSTFTCFTVDKNCRLFAFICCMLTVN